MSTAIATTSTIADLLLVRMSLAGKSAPKTDTVRKNLGELIGSEPSGSVFEDLQQELADAGFLIRRGKSFAITDTGRQRALEFLGVDGLPPKTNWKTVVSKYLFPKAAGMTSDDAGKMKGNQLAVLLLKRKYEIGSSAKSVNQLLPAIAGQHLGFPNVRSADELICAVLSTLLGSERLTKKQVQEQLPLFGTGLTSTKADEIRARLVRDWLGVEAQTLGREEQPPISPPIQVEPLDLSDFAATVRALAARSRPEDRFHDNKVFIAALWRASQQEPSFPRMSLESFKQNLVEANSRNLLHLSRADLVQAMDPQLVAESETTYLNASFHFVLIEGDQV